MDTLHISINDYGNEDLQTAQIPSLNLLPVHESKNHI